MEQNINRNVQNNDEISIKEIIDTFKKYWSYLLSKWYIILIFGLTGGALGLGASLLIKPKYTAHLTFALVEKSSGGGLADLASSFGLGGLLGGSSSAFSGDNLIEIIKSRHAVEQTLLSSANYKGENKTLAEVYIQFNELRKSWSKNKRNPQLKNLSFPFDQKRETFTQTQDSVLHSIYLFIIKSNSLMVTRKDKKIGIVTVDFKSKDELFSKLFVEELMNQTYLFYKDTKTSQNRVNINMMQHTADSIKRLYENALYKSAGFSQVNINSALQYAAVPRIKQESDARLYGTVYAEVLKNLETLKLEMARETPLVQMIDMPRLPLIKDRLGKAKGIVIGGILGGLIITFFLLGHKFFKNSLKTESSD